MSTVQQSPEILRNAILSPQNNLPQVELYESFRGTETDMDIIDGIWCLHGDNYLRSGYITPEALDIHGHVSPEIDHARGPNVEYYASIHPEGRHVVASFRKIHIPDDQYLDFLPAFTNCQSGISEEGLELLDAYMQQGKNVVEIAALSKVKGADPMAVLEIYRNAIQDSLRRQELWFMGLVPDTLKLLKSIFGDKIIQVIGEPVSFNDHRIEGAVTLTPVLIDPQVVPESLLDYSLGARKEGDMARAYEAENLLIPFIDGLTPEERGPRVERAITFMVNGLSLDLLAEEEKII